MMPCKEEEDDSQLKQLTTDQKIDKILDQLEEGTIKQKAHIFSAGYIYEAKSFIQSLISKATTRVILVDGYISSETIDLLDIEDQEIIYTLTDDQVRDLLLQLSHTPTIAQFQQLPLAQQTRYILQASHQGEEGL